MILKPFHSFISFRLFLSWRILYSTKVFEHLHFIQLFLSLAFDCLIRIFYYIQHIFYCTDDDFHINAFTCLKQPNEKKTNIVQHQQFTSIFFLPKTFFLLHFHCESHFRLTDEKIEMKKKQSGKKRIKRTAKKLARKLSKWMSQKCEQWKRP